MGLRNAIDTLGRQLGEAPFRPDAVEQLEQPQAPGEPRHDVPSGVRPGHCSFRKPRTAALNAAGFSM